MRTATVLILLASSTAHGQLNSYDAPAAAAVPAAAQDGRTQSSIRRLHEVIRRGASAEAIGQARLELARLYQREGDWWNAVQQIQTLRKLAPSDPESVYQLGIAYSGLSKWAFDRMQSLAPNAARTQQMLGEQYAISGENEHAIKAFQQAIKSDPKLEGSHLALAALYLRLQKRAEAAAEIEQELAIVPDSAVAKQLQKAIATTSR
jgi:tetratricopeptide (TPR) repeat protein